MTGNNLALPETQQWMRSLRQLEDSLAVDKANAISSQPRLPRPLTSQERAFLARRADEARKYANAAPDMETALIEIAQVVLAFPAAKLEGEQAKARVKAYSKAMDDVPTWAIAEAARRWLKGDVSLPDANLSFPPSPPQLRLLAAEELAKAKAALLRAERLLNGVVEKPKKLSEDRRREAEEILGRYGYGTAQTGE